MDINLSYAVSDEDLVGVLRTIWLFLESLNFRETSSTLQIECSSKGYSSVNSAKAKVLVVTPSIETKPEDCCNARQLHQGNQTEYPLDVDEPYDIDGSLHESDHKTPPEPVYVYYTDVANFSNRIISETIIDNYLGRTTITTESINERAISPRTDEDKDNNKDGAQIVESSVEKPKGCPNMSPNSKGKKLKKYCPPKTIETDMPSKISCKTTIKPTNQNSKENIKKCHSNLSLNVEAEKTCKQPPKNNGKTNSKIPRRPLCKNEQDIDNIDGKDLKKKFRQLQKDHQKLMSVTTELTTALQTHIMGQSENLNAMLNNCRNIYPDLFTPGSSEIPNKTVQQKIETCICASNKSPQETVAFKVISTQTLQRGATSVSNSLTKVSSDILTVESTSSDSNQNVELISSAPETGMKKNSVDSGNQTHGVTSCEENRKCLSASDTFAKRTSVDFANAVVVNDSAEPIITNENLSHANYCCEEPATSTLKEETLNPNVNEDKTAPCKSGMKIKETQTNFSVASKLKRTRSSSIVLEKTSNTEVAPKVSARTLSSKSCDDVLLICPTKPNSSQVTFDLKIRDIDDESGQESSEENILEDTNDAKPEMQDTSYVNYANCKQTPEIYVTTDNLAKLKRGQNPSSDSNLGSPRNQYSDLDFRKLKKDMLNGDDDLKLALVQALRWRITQSDGEARDQIISSYIRHDLLGLHSSPNSCGQSTLELYYTPNKETPHPLQEMMARLVNTFASLTLGRDYLCQDDDLLVSLLAPLTMGTHYSKANINDITRDMLMATLQKLSLRNRQRLRMISAGLVEHLVNFLATKQNSVSAYCMEYATALFMNLCLHHEARERLHPFATDVISLLADLLNTRHQCCVPYVNGAMYSLLGDPYINQEAQRLNLAKVIEYHIKRTDGEMRRQLKFILKLHVTGPGDNDCGCDPNIEPENEVDLLEPELDSGDSYNQQPSGEKLLKNYKLLFSVYGSQVYATHLKCFCRPVTPFPQSLKQSEKSEDDKMEQQDKPMEEIRKKCTCEKSTQSAKCVCRSVTQFPQSLKQPEKSEDDKMEQQDKPVEEIRKKCTCEKSTQSTNPHLKPCSCRTRATSPKVSNDEAQSSPARTRGGSEPLTTLKANTNINKTTMSEQSSRLNSPEMSFCEETQKFYYTPSAKTGIFEPQKTKKLHRVAPSFTRTIPLPVRIEHPPQTCSSPHCPYPYTKTMPIRPKDNSNVRNPPFALHFDNYYPTCYREGYRPDEENVNKHTDCECYNCNNVCPNCNKRNKYACSCYNVIKGFIDDNSQEDHNDNRNDNNSRSCNCNAQQNLCHNCQISHSPRNKSIRTATTKAKPTNSGTNSVVNFSYEELSAAVNTDDRDHVCPNPEVECRCRDEVFQSRPKILRTPP